GRLDITDLGPFAALKDTIAHFVAAPTDRTLAEDLGRRLIPDAMFSTTPDALHVMLDGPLLSALPIVALRHDGRPLIAARPVVRAPRISELACVPPAAQPHRAIAVADADGDLPEARSEAVQLAALLPARAEIGSEATSGVVLAATSGDLLHIAVHADVDDSGGFLKLHDRNLHALEISAHGIGPGLVVLSSCKSAQAKDFALVGSLASAFLAGGSAQVVATLRSVTDRGAREVTAAFYRAGGASDPVRALARAQAQLADSDNPDWPNFAVFGHELCRTKQ
ncbi:MAG TPA: CHAT domain-containing protein, partial [Kofleriaceae bacterium]|nr:CHAT domain-containing protein [Kofleriaceae bacterium]